MRTIIILSAVLAASVASAQERPGGATVTVTGTNYMMTITPEAARKLCVGTDQITNQLVVSSGGDSKYCINRKTVYCDPPVWRDANDPQFCSGEIGKPKVW